MENMLWERHKPSKAITIDSKTWQAQFDVHLACQGFCEQVAGAPG